MSPGDKVIITESEHHSDIVPWQLACARCGCGIEVLPVDEAGEISVDELDRRLAAAGGRIKLVAMTHISNILGIVNPVKEAVSAAHRHGVPVLVDGAQGAVHAPVDVQDLDCDFYAFSGHKIYAPTGIGVLYGKSRYLGEMPPYMGGGEMIDTVSFEKTTYAPLPLKYEAGTQNFTAAACMAPALEMAKEMAEDAEVQQNLRSMRDYLLVEFGKIEGLRVYGRPRGTDPGQDGNRGPLGSHVCRAPPAPLWTDVDAQGLPCSLQYPRGMRNFHRRAPQGCQNVEMK